MELTRRSPAKIKVNSALNELTEPAIAELADELFGIQEDLLTRYESLLPTTDDTSLMVIKGHLAIEEALRALADVVVRKPEALKKANLKFFQLVQVLKALGHLPDRVEKAINILTSLRNKFAHSLEPASTHQLVKDLYTLCRVQKYMGSFEGFAKPKLDAKMVELSVYTLMAFLHMQVLAMGILQKPE